VNYSKERSEFVSTEGNVQVKPRFYFGLRRAIAPVIAPIMATVLGVSSGVLLLEAIALQPVYAQASRVSVSLQRQPNESFETFISRAEAAARAAAQQNFTGSATSDVSVTVLGESAGLVAPLLSLEVTRDNWRSRSDPQQWATYYSDARTLLGFESLAPATAAQPTPTAPDQPTAPPTDPATAEPTAQPPATAPATTIVPPAVPPAAQPAPSESGDLAPGEPQQAPGSTDPQPGINTPTPQPAEQTDGPVDDAQQPALEDPNVGDTTDNAPQPQNSTQQPDLGDPSVDDQTTTNEAPQTEVDTPDSVPTPGPIGVPEVFDPGPIGVPRSGVRN
jgi:hypothetical protein